MNVSNRLKNKIIKHDKLNDDDRELFIKYIINKTKDIVDNIYIRDDYNYMYLFFEICYSYNIDYQEFNNDRPYAVIKIDNKKYIVDMNFDDDRLAILKKNKYIEYTKDDYNLYLKIINGG